jgi:mono/diheme cytochrome c family protein
MRRILVWLGRAAAALLVIGIIAIAGLWIASDSVLARTYQLQPEKVRAAGPDTVREGWRLSKLYGCTSCHGPELRGHLFNDEPALVRNHAPNLTLLAARYSDEHFAQAIRQGVRPSDGRALWGMPSAVFSTISDAELAAVLAFIRSVKPGGKPNPTDHPGLKSRLAIVLNHYRPSDPATTAAVRSAPEQIALARRRPPADLGARYAQGRHLTATICSECHGSDLGGDATEGGPDLAIAGAYDREAFHRLLRTGVPPGGRDLGIMSEAAREDFRVFTDGELDAIHSYLKARAERQ